MSPRLIASFATRLARTAILAVTALLTFTPSARALDLPEASTFANCYTSVGIISDVLFCSTHTDLAQVTQAPFAGTHAEATYPGSFDVAGAAAEAGLTYHWAVVGGQPGDLVHVSVGINLSAEAFGPHGQAFAAVWVTTAPSGIVEACVSVDGICGAGSTHGFNGVMQVVARSGDVNTLQMLSTAGGAFGPDVNGGSASADPLFFFDPAFPLSGDYQLLLSPGIANAVAPAPEPATWAMFGLGLAGLAVLRRRRAQA